MIVVSNTSPLSNLGGIGYLHLLPALYGLVQIPEAVRKELEAEGPDTLAVQALRAGEWLEVKPVTDAPLLILLKETLDTGEAEALALSVMQQADLLLVDERAARRLATRLGIARVGVVGVLLEAKRRGLVPAVRPMLGALKAQGFWLGEDVIELALREAGEGT